MAFGLSWIVAIVGLAAVASVSAVPSGRVVGGFDATAGQFPHQVSLQQWDGTHTCGGSILNQRFILTAAHCVVNGGGVEPYPPQYFQVRVGSIQYNAGGKLVQLKRIIVNKSYGNFLNDIALLELQEFLEWTYFIQPIQMAYDEVPSGRDVLVSGWGRLYTNGPIPYRLQWNTLKALNTAQCGALISWGYDSLICLAHEVDNGVCNGDSGGPATYDGKLVGVASFVLGGCGSRNPDVYTKVYYYRQWIESNMTPSD